MKALGKPSSIAPFIMPARIAETPPGEELSGEQIREPVGGGPIVYLQEEWKPVNQAECA